MSRFRCKNGTVQRPAKSRKCVAKTKAKNKKTRHMKKNDKLRTTLSSTSPKTMTDVAQRKLQIQLVKAHIKVKLAQLKPVLKTLSKAEKTQANAYYDELYWASIFAIENKDPIFKQKYIDMISMLCNPPMNTNLEKAYAYRNFQHLLGELEVFGKSYILEGQNYSVSTEIAKHITDCYKDII